MRRHKYTRKIEFEQPAPKTTVVEEKNDLKLVVPTKRIGRPLGSKNKPKTSMVDTAHWSLVLSPRIDQDGTPTLKVDVDFTSNKNGGGSQ